MARQPPLPLLMILLGLFALSVAGRAQTADEGVDTTGLTPDRLEVQRIEELIKFGPHYKNPRAAGRIKVLYRTAPVATNRPSRPRLTGPAYKNQRRLITQADTAVTRPTKPRLTGPRYKNRGAKASKDRRL